MTNNLSLMVYNEIGILSRITNLLVSKNFPILNLSLNSTELSNISKIFLELSGSKEEIDQIIKQLTKLIEVIEVKKVNLDNTIERQLMLVKVICSPTKRTALLEIANIFKANIIHISDTFFIFEIFGSSEKVLNFQKIVKIYGTINVVKTGKIFIEK
jgi:acetolactate synthase-1/3 small subunit|uniref:Acetolactate synthase small subunit n=1 Tax=Poterioochromonas malhamensis TaxID=88167 RepID=A0A7T7BWD3_9STRA|nr:acetohydroxyacid synthase small subunit [Poterioochromonas malhamensis]QQK55037.1 acetohydroxyacid synthase small subunit [Poterioochromonas malhamensis]|eukprot:gene24112-gene19476